MKRPLLQDFRKHGNDHECAAECKTYMSVWMCICVSLCVAEGVHGIPTVWELYQSMVISWQIMITPQIHVLAKVHSRNIDDLYQRTSGD